MKILSVDEVRDRLKINSDTELRDMLGYAGTGTISKWRASGIPVKAMARIWNMLGEEEKPLDEIKRLFNREMDILIEEARGRQNELGLMEDFHAFIRAQHEKMKSEL